MRNFIFIFSLFFFYSALKAQDTPPTETLTVKQINEAFGLPLWSEASLWEADVVELAERLNWPLESETKDQSSYRLYADEKVRVLDRRPYSLAFYSENNQVTEVRIFFINKGDYGNASDLEVSLKRAEDKKEKSRVKELTKQYEELLKTFPDAVKEEAAFLEERLTSLFGAGMRDTFGQGSSLKEKVTRWNWNSHAILLSEQENEYVSIRIMPLNAADQGGNSTARTDSEMRTLLLSRVLKKDNGDVTVTEIPMVDQGRKGFCVPATWERYLRYMGISTDMYVLAMGAKTEFGGGTQINAIATSVESLVKKNKRRLDQEKPSLDPKDLASSIDKGLPLMWAMYIDRSLDSEITARSLERKDVTDWKDWNDQLKSHRKKAKSIKPDPENGHVCMIIGYNEITQEIATSDSWGPDFKERWLTVEEAEAISQGDIRIIRW